MKEFAIIQISKNKFVVARFKAIIGTTPQYEQISKPLFDKDALKLIQELNDGKKKVNSKI